MIGWDKEPGKGAEVQKKGIHLLWTVSVVILLPLFLLSLGCRKKEEAPPSPRITIRPGPATEESEDRPEQPVSFYSVLTKDLKNIAPATSFSRNDRIYLYTTWRGLKGLHEIKVLWVRPDGGVQETVRIKEKVSPRNPTFTTWAYISFKKGLLNISPFEAKFIGRWKAQLFLDGKLLAEYPFSVS